MRMSMRMSGSWAGKWKFVCFTACRGPFDVSQWRPEFMYRRKRVSENVVSSQQQRGVGI
jgi:hypothetical protein